MQIPKLIKMLSCLLLMSSYSVTYAGTLSPKDADIVSTINSKIAKNISTANSNVAVTSHGGLVSLTGKVNTSTEANKLIEISESVPGVTNVDTKQLKVKKSKQALSDAEITAKVKGTYLREKVFGNSDVPLNGINVTTVNGVVYLTGKVDNKDKVVNAVKLAMTIKGVKRIDSKIKVTSVG